MESASWKQPFHLFRRLAAKTWLKFFPNLKIIAITGSYGKTNTSQAINNVLSQNFKTLQTDIGLDTVYNLPITILKVNSMHKALVLECCIDHKGEMDSYLKLFKPNVAIITGISPVHAEPELLGSIEGIMEEKGKLIEALPKNGWAILNHDDPNVLKMASRTKAQVLWYGSNDSSDIWADDIRLDTQGTSFTLHSPKFKIDNRKLKIGLLGKHFVQEAMAAAVVGLIYGLTNDQIERGLRDLNPLPGRLSLEEGPAGTMLLDDHLRANPASVKAGLETLVALPCQGRKIAVLGEMGELGQYKEEEHKKIGKFVVELRLDYLICVGPLQQLTADEAIKNGMAKSQVYWVKDVSEATEVLKKILSPGDLWYLKGSLLKHMERIIYALEDKNVSCNLISCHFYNQCVICPDLGK